MTATLAAIQRATGRALWGDAAHQVATAVAELDDVGYIVDALRQARLGRNRWKEAVAMVELLARTGPEVAVAAAPRPPSTTQLRLALTQALDELSDLETYGGTGDQRDEVEARIQDLRSQLAACQDGIEQEATG